MPTEPGLVACRTFIELSGLCVCGRCSGGPNCWDGSIDRVFSGGYIGGLIDSGGLLRKPLTFGGDVGGAIALWSPVESADGSAG